MFRQTIDISLVAKACHHCFPHFALEQHLPPDGTIAAKMVLFTVLFSYYFIKVITIKDRDFLLVFVVRIFYLPKRLISP